MKNYNGPYKLITTIDLAYLNELKTKGGYDTIDNLIKDALKLLERSYDMELFRESESGY